MNETKRKYDHILWGNRELCYQDFPDDIIIEMIKRHKKDSVLIKDKGEAIHFIHYRMPIPDDFIPYDV